MTFFNAWYWLWIKNKDRVTCAPKLKVFKVPNNLLKAFELIEKKLTERFGVSYILTEVSEPIRHY